jgi:hypothetical protein
VKRGLSIGATVFLVAAVMGYWYESHSAAAHVRQCMSGVSSMRSTLEQAGAIDTRGAAYLTEERLRTAAKPFCKEAARDSRVGSRNPETRQRAISELIRTHPEVWDPMCKLGIEAELLSNSDLRFMTASERRRFQRDECRYRRGYMAETVCRSTSAGSPRITQSTMSLCALRSSCPRSAPAGARPRTREASCVRSPDAHASWGCERGSSMRRDPVASTAATSISDA